MSDTTTTDRRALAVETDTALADLYQRLAQADDRRDRQMDEMHRAVGDTRASRWSGPWQMTDAEVIAFDGNLPTWDQRSYAEAKARHATLTHEIGQIRQEVARLNEVWADSGYWHRYLLVDNPSGHVHRDQSCSTCYPTTQYLWLVELADCDEAEMVATYGEMACTVCFPDAPAHRGYGDGTSTLARYSEAEKAAKDAEKAAKAAAKAAKGITQPDGQPLREEDWRTRQPGAGSVIKTERSASIALTDALQNALVFGYDPERYLAQAHYLAEALAAKRGQSVEEVMADHEQKARKRK